MIIRHNIPVYSICWLNHAKGGKIGTLYEPENIDELRNICSSLYQKGQQFDVIGHTSNIYFLPNYSVGHMVSTRKCNNYSITEDEIICDCGVSVIKLAHRMVDEGIKGFEGLIDLPGTVGASVYGNASCFKCSINSLLNSFDLLQPNGEIVTLSVNDLKISQRSSTLKRGELNGVILTVRLKKEKGNTELLKSMAEKNHHTRITKHPESKDNLGSIYASKHRKTILHFILKCLVKSLSIVYSIIGNSKYKKNNEREMFFTILGAKDLLPYVYGWNRYIWKDEQAHTLFWKYNKLHRLLFKNSDFEIEIKGNISKTQENTFTTENNNI